MSVILLMMVAYAVAACTPVARLPDLAEIYAEAARHPGAQSRRPLIAVPGTLGSRLVDRDSGRVVWGGGASQGISADPEDPGEYRLIALPIPRGDEPLSAVRDRVVPAGVLGIAMIEVLGIPVDIEVYAGVARSLRAGGFNVAPTAQAEAAGGPSPDYDTFRFDYDWRRDLIETAGKFGAFIRERRAAVAARRGVPPETVRFDLLAHSMGGLVTRYFLMYGDAVPGPDGTLPPVTWAGAEYFERVVFVATPNAGSIVALDNLINGKSLGPFQPEFPPELLATHPSVYQLMPRARHNRVTMAGAPVDDLYDPALWVRMGWGLAASDADRGLAVLMPDEPDPARRRDRARRYLTRLLRRAEEFHRMMDRPASPPAHLDMFLVVGGGFETPAAAEIDPATGAFSLTGVEEGDGVVLRASALMDERQGQAFSPGLRSPLSFRSILLLPDEHVELTRNPIFGDNLLFWLLEVPRGSGTLARPSGADFFVRERASAPPALSDGAGLDR